MIITISDSERRAAAELYLRLPAWTDASSRDALREIAFTPFIRSIDKDDWLTLVKAAREDIEAAEDETETDDDREMQEARAIFNRQRAARDGK